jgi:hypothetical protein
MPHHARWSAAGLIVIGLGVGAVQQLHLFDGTDSTPLSVTEAEQRYDDSIVSTTIGPPPAPGTTIGPLAAPGVYVYDTTGRDSVDALNGAHHDYPAITTITLTATACGLQQRWDVLVERWQEWRHCADAGGVSEIGRINHDEFFGQSQTDSWVCTGAPRPLAASAGTAWSTECVSGSTTDTHHGVVVGAEQQTVGTTTVDTLHVQVTIISATPSDSQLIDTWYLAGTDLVVAQTSTVATSNESQIGTVHYAENYEIHLTSLTPST